MNPAALAFIRKVSPSILHIYLERLEMSPLRWRLARGIFWSLAGGLISRGLYLPASILVARILGRESFGEMGIIHSTVGMFGGFAGFGLGLTATKYIAEFRVKDPAKAGRILCLSGMTAVFTGGLAALLLFIFAPWLAENTLAAPHLTDVLRIGSIILLFNALNGAQGGALAGFEAFKTIARISLFVGLADLPLIVGGCYLAGVKGAVWGTAAAMGLYWLLNRLAIRSELHRFHVPVRFSGCWKEWRILWSFSLPTVLSGAMLGPVNWICFAMLVNQTNGYAEMGIFNAANQWRTAILFLPNLIGGIVLPILSSLTAIDQRHDYNRILRANILINGIVAFGAAILISLLAPVILGVYGRDFIGGKYVLVFLSFSTVFMAMNDVIGLAIASMGKMWYGLLFNSLWAVLLIACTYILLGYHYGAMGLAAAIFISYIMHSVWQGVYFYRFLQAKR